MFVNDGEDVTMESSATHMTSSSQQLVIHEDSKLPCSSSQLENVNQQFLASQLECSAMVNSSKEDQRSSSDDSSIIYKLKCVKYTNEELTGDDVCFEAAGQYEQEAIEQSSIDNDKVVDVVVDCANRPDSITREEIIKLSEDEAHIEHYTQQASMSVSDYPTNDGDLVSSSVGLSAVLPTTASIENSELDREFLQGISNSQRFTLSLQESDHDARSRVGSLYQMSAADMMNGDLGGTREAGDVSSDVSMTSSRFAVPELLDPALLRLIDHRLSTVIGSSLSSLPPDQKEMLLESVVRNMIGIVGNRLYTSDGVLLETKLESPSLNKDVSSTGYGGGELHMAPMYAEASGLIDTLANRVESPQCASSNLLHMEDVSLEVIAPGARPALALHQSAGDAANKMVEMIDHQTVNELQVNSSSASSSEHLIQVPVSEVSGTSGLLNFVSSSTGLDREVVCLDGQNVVLDTSVDAVVVSSDGQTGQEKTLHLVDSAGQPFAIELENQDGSTLRFSEIDSERYSTEVHIHELDADQNVTSTVDISNDAALMAVSKGGDAIATTSIDLPLTLVHHHIDAACSSMATDSIMAIPDNKQLTGHSRPRRNLAKHRLSRNSSDNSVDLGKSEFYSLDPLGCEECNASYASGCNKHRVQLISDKPVLTRARASLPATYLSISKVATTTTGDNVYGVVAKKAITKRTQFGPLEGAQSKKPEGVSGSSSFVLQLETEDNELVSIDTSDESQSNWMGFVRAAENYKEQNLVVIQQGQCLYYTTTRTIVPKTELKVGYSLQYATRRGLTVLEADKQVKDEEDNSWPCFECNKSFSTSEELQHHLNEHDGTDVVSETIPFDEEKAKATAARKYSKSKSKSSKKSKTNSGLKKSKKSVGGSEEYRCELCLKTFPRQYSLQRHQAMHSGEKKYKCSVCDMRFTHVYNRNRHMRRHRTQSIPVESSTVKKPIKTLFKKRQVGGCEWECTHCNLTFDNPSLLNLHTLTHAAEDVGLDEFNIDSVINNKDHDFHENGYDMEDVISSEVLQCPQCTQSFPTKKELIEHASTHGKILQRKSFRGIVNPAKPYKCDLCYKAFAAEDRLQRHMMVHGSEEEKPLQCCFCEKRFLNNSALACHVKVHSDEKKIYECPICKEEFDQVVLLKEHIRIHSISGYFTCPNCQKSFDEYNQIRKHIRIFHSDKKFPCDHCDKVFPRPDKLKLHMLRHSTHREFLCASCGKQFKRKDKLKEHMKRMHSMEREARLAMKPQKVPSLKKFIPKVLPTDYHRFIYKCHACLLGFKRRGMLVNHLAKRHPDIRPESVPELNLPILKTTRDYYCQYCEKIYKSSSKRKAHIMKQHPGAELPMSNRRKGGIPEIPGMPNPTYSQTVGSVTTLPHNCEWCHKQYASKAKLLQHQRKKHISLLPEAQQVPRSHHRDSVKPNSQQLYVHEQITVTTQTSDVEFSDSVTDEMKSKNEVTEIYVDQDEVHTTVVVAPEEKTNQASSAEQMPPADLLTQAMSELTQSLTEYVSHDFNLTRTQQPCSSAFVASSSSSQPVVVSRPTEVAIDQSQLGQLLGHHYQGKIEPSSHQEGGVAISSSFIQQSWTRTNFTEYSDH